MVEKYLQQLMPMQGKDSIREQTNAAMQTEDNLTYGTLPIQEKEGVDKKEMMVQEEMDETGNGCFTRDPEISKYR